jgi:hypothetical protein
MEEVSGTSKEFIFEKTVRLLKDGCYIFREKASAAIDLDRSWTQKALIDGMIQYALLNNPLYCEESRAIGCAGDIVYLIKPLINDFYRWIVYKFGQDECGKDIVVFIISAHKDEKIYGQSIETIIERGDENEKQER